ncbi:MAG: hypothetical protein JSS34_03380 [Proteobacteria bacterium]|nr:hypothetical protein [Pseudomonadota bacterium]
MFFRILSAEIIKKAQKYFEFRRICFYASQSLCFGETSPFGLSYGMLFEMNKHEGS